MSVSMLNPPNPAFRNDCPRGGILLNATRPTSQSASPIQSPLQRPYMPSSPSSSSSSGSDESVNRKFSPGRRITFAPLPNPRAQEPDLPLIVLDPATDGIPTDSSDNGISYLGDDSNMGQGGTASTQSSPLLGASAKKNSSWNSTKKWLRPFYKPLQKAATLDVGEGGALGLFRASSRESNNSSTGTLTDSGYPLARRMSTGTTPSNVGPSNHFIPDRNLHSLALTPVISENGGVAAGTKMLNGRVYGRSRVAATKQAEPEPEFVEWGYGGMGSNKGASASSTYAKVQSSRAEIEDEDDGSGMGWVRKRREAREREKREREEREAQEKAKESEQQDESPKEDAQKEGDSSPAPPVEASTPTVDEAPASTAIPPEHITQTVAIPVRQASHHGHSLKASNSRRSSDTRLSTTAASGSSTPVHAPGSGRSTPMLARMSTESTHTVTAATSGPSSLRNAIEPESASSSSDEEDDDTEETTEREDNQGDEVDDEDDANERKTALCAGVEKISRHKD